MVMRRGTRRAQRLCATGSRSLRKKETGTDEVVCEYESPEMSKDESTVTRRWRVVNNLPEAASNVMMTHHVSPPLPVERVTGPSEVVGDSVKSRWQAPASGESVEGEIVAKLPEDLEGSVRVIERRRAQQPVLPSPFRCSPIASRVRLRRVGRVGRW